MGTVTEYINEKLPSVDALGDLDNLVSTLEDQQAILNTQIQDIQAKIVAEQDALFRSSDAILNQVAEFRAGHGKLKDRLLNARYRSRPKFMDDLQGLVTKLEKFELARDYFVVLGEVQRLSESAKATILDDPGLALQTYDELVKLVGDVCEKNREAEDSAVHLVDFLCQSKDFLWLELREQLATEFRGSLDGIGWPRRVSLEADFEEFIRTFNKLLQFQFPNVSGKVGDSNQPEVIIALEIMTEPLDLRFRYHFEGNRETNKVDRPEWFFSHFISTVEDHEQFMETIVQGILEQSPYLSNREALHELIYAYLPSVRRKLKTLIPAVMHEPQLFSHLMLETMKFDDHLRDTYLFAPYGHVEWHGIYGDIMTKPEWFEGWLSVEKDFALARYQEIITTPDAWVIDFDSVGESESKPTKSAIRLRDLLETVSERYRPLKSFVHRIRFLMDIQIAILDSYHNRISSSLDAFESLTSSIVRAVSGVHEEERKKMVDGLAGIERLCRAYGSAYTIRDALNDWGEDIFFLELYHELNLRASQSKKTRIPMELEGISSKLPDGLEEDGTIFDEIIKAYDALRTRAENLIIKHLSREVQKAYKNDSAFRQSVKSKDGLAADLFNSSASIAEMIAYLSRALSQPSFTRVSRALYRSFNL
ncbi:TIP-1 family-domain-containing protein [Lipomyces orientalis]|uniref:TIP-1 family-domain-containing protein n=1 Tax=Lipomyces orientalis TaxID=1233043 RepID=A0ACC3TEH0_9ASCO